MPNVFVNDEYLKATANAIRSKFGKSQTYFPSEMAPAILSIQNSDIYKFNGIINSSIMTADSKYYHDIVKAINEKTGEANSYTPAEMAIFIRENMKFAPPPPPFEWGDENAVGDENWWNSLLFNIGALDPNELKQYLGKTKKITLLKPILGTTTHLIRCIGYNLDRDENNLSANTLTFQTANCLDQAIQFGPSNGYWNKSTALQKCEEYYNAFPYKPIIATVSKGTCTSLTSTQDGIPRYYGETVFLPSDGEMGFVEGKDSSNGKGYASSYDEFCEQNSSKIPYQYYTSDENRIKKLGDFGSNRGYWNRSLSAKKTSFACTVYSDGTPDFVYYTDTEGLAPAFCIAGKKS